MPTCEDIAPRYSEHESESRDESHTSRSWPVPIPSRSVRWVDARSPASALITWEPDHNQYLDGVLGIQKLINLKGDPDDDGFLPISEETIRRAKRFLIPYIPLFASPPLVPIISPGPHGSIDIHWKTPKKEFLVNIPANQNMPALFYGDDYGNLSIEGRLDTDALSLPVVVWLLST